MRRYYLGVLLLLFFSCREDRIVSKSCDPQGTVTTTIVAAPYLGAYTEANMICLAGTNSGCIVVESDVTNNVLWSVDYSGQFPGSEVATLFDMGVVSCLSSVVSKSTDFYSFQVPIRLHHGYVVRLYNNTFGRIFVQSWEVDGSGIVTQATLKWQYPI